VTSAAGRTSRCAGDRRRTLTTGCICSRVDNAADCKQPVQSLIQQP
jgi:hypothetical protein